MARMMDSLIMNDFPPYTFTKITTTHRPTRTNGISTTSKLMTKSTANISTAATGNHNNNNSNINNNSGNSTSSYGLNSGMRQATLQKTKLPMQGINFDFLKVVTADLD